MERFEAEFVGSLESVGKARQALVTYASWVGLAGESLSDFEYAIGEALANAAEHGYQSNPSFGVVAFVIENTLTIEIKDGGNGFTGWNSVKYAKPIFPSPRGFGIFIMRTLMDEIEYSEGGTKVRLVKKIPIPETLNHPQ